MEPLGYISLSCIVIPAYAVNPIDHACIIGDSDTSKMRGSIDWSHNDCTIVGFWFYFFGDMVLPCLVYSMSCCWTKIFESVLLEEAGKLSLETCL